MQFGIIATSSLSGVSIAPLAEELGFDTIRFWDSPLVSADIFVVMAHAITLTRRIRVGAGVYVPWTRSPAVTACGFASLNAMAPGRIDFCASTGFTARRAFGLKGQPVADFAAHMRAAVGLMRGEEVDFEIEGGTRRLRLLHPDLTLNVKDPIGVQIATGGPRGMALVAELGAGWMDAPGLWGDYSIGDMQALWSGAGRDVESLHCNVNFATVALLREGEAISSPRIRKIAGPQVLSGVHRWIDHELIHGKPLPDGLSQAMRRAVSAYRKIFPSPHARDAALRLHTGHVLFVRPEEEAILNDELVRERVLVLTKDQLIDKIEQLEQAGVKEITFSVATRENLLELAEALGPGRLKRAK